MALPNSPNNCGKFLRNFFRNCFLQQILPLLPQFAFPFCAILMILLTSCSTSSFFSDTAAGGVKDMDAAGNLITEGSGRSINFNQRKIIHEKRLRKHFISGCKCGQDISALIHETMIISEELKRLGRKKEARKFDSYVDVLMFGNRTINESLEDVMKLVRKPV
jgi:hypothetical protein